MSEFTVPVKTIVAINQHPHADRLQIAKIDGYSVVVPIDVYQTGQRVAYIPEGALVPDWLIQQLGLQGKLAGKKKNRVKAIKLRGELSQGLVYSLKDNKELLYLEDGDLVSYEPVDGECVAHLLSITKYTPPTPTRFNGYYKKRSAIQTYDIQDIKKHVDWFQSGEFIIATEKIHGTQCTFGWDASNQEWIVASKGIAENGSSFLYDDAKNDRNIYVQTFRRYLDKLKSILNIYGRDKHWYLFGEIYGHGVQDLKYDTYDNKQFYRAFDLYVGEPNKGYYIQYDKFIQIMIDVQIPSVPIVYRGAYDQDFIARLAEQDSYLGKAGHIREGLVVRPFEERMIINERIIAKFVSTRYLTRNDGTEYN